MRDEPLCLMSLLHEHGAEIELAVAAVGGEALRRANEDARAALAQLSTLRGPPDFEALNRMHEAVMARANAREAALSTVSAALGLAAGLALGARRSGPEAAPTSPNDPAGTPSGVGRAALRAALAALREDLSPQDAATALWGAGAAVQAPLAA